MVRATQHNAHTPPSKTGHRAALRDLPHINGSGAPKLWLLPVLVLVSMAFTAAPALAAAPETPETGKANPTTITATTATLEGGVLNPHAAGEVGEYEYRFRVSETECEGESSTAPEAAAGKAKEAIPSVDLTNLQPNAHYTFCLIEHNLGGEYSVSSTPVHFTTKPAVPAVEGESVSGRSDSGPAPAEARLEATVRANNEEVTKCEFQYGTDASLATSTSAPCEQATPFPGVYEGQPADLSLTGLAPNTTYYYRAVATNATGVSTGTAIESFVTPLHPEAPVTEKVTNNTTGTSVTLNGTLNPGQAVVEPGEEYKFVYERSESHCDGIESREAPPFSNLSANGQQQEAVSFQLNGLLPHTAYMYCAIVSNGVSERAVGNPVSFETPVAAPTIANASATNIGSSEVTIAAEIDPGGESTTYEIEYGPGEFTPEQTLPASKTAVPVSERLAGLTPGTKYEIKLFAHHKEGSKGSAESSVSFETSLVVAGHSGASACANATFSGFNPALPDCRAAELVTPAGELGETYDPGGSFDEGDPTTPRPFRAASSGGSVAYLADPGAAPGGDGSSAKSKGNQYIATRGPGSGPDGWEIANITPPVGFGENASDEREYEAFSPDLTVGIIASQQPLLAAKPSPQAPKGCNALYSHDGGGYHALFTETQTPPECGKVESEGGSQGRDGKMVFAGESADHSQKFFQTPAPLVAPAVEGGFYGGNLYDSVGGSLSVVNILPTGGLAEQGATFGGPSELPDNAPDFSDAVAANGSRVFWSTVEPGESFGEAKAAFPVALYAREDPASPSASTVQLDAAEPKCLEKGECTSGGGQFWAASNDGSKVFFTDCNKLTEHATAVSGGGCQHGGAGTTLVKTGNDLYEYDFNAPAGERLTDLTDDDNAGDPLGANVQGVIGQGESSEDGSFIYFVAGGALTTEPSSWHEAPSTQGCEESGSCNLYELHNNGTNWETPRFIATLAERDDNLKFEKLNDPFSGAGDAAGDWAPDLGSRTAEVTPDGRHLVFESTRQLTGYDNGDVDQAQIEEGGVEIFTFSAASNRLACASCNPTGAPPDAAIQLGQNASYSPYLPVSSSNTFMHRWINAAGNEVFFDSSQPLVTGDSNGTQDVYEWEAEETPGCPTATSIYGGCVFLLSGGESTDYSFLVDTDESGENVFLTHRGQLDGVGPHGEKGHLYDLRVDGGFPETSYACTGTGCQGVPPAAPLFATPASATFSGAGNLTPAPTKVVVKSLTRAQKLTKALQGCRKDKRKQKRVACEKQARKHYGPVKSKSKSGKRSAKQGGRKS